MFHLELQQRKTVQRRNESPILIAYCAISGTEVVPREGIRRRKLYSAKSFKKRHVLTVQLISPIPAFGVSVPRTSPSPPSPITITITITMIPAFSASVTPIFRHERNRSLNCKKKNRFVALPISPRCSLSPSSSSSDAHEGPERQIAIVSVSMTAGGEVLFPGTRLDVEVSFEAAMRASDATNSEFGYLPIDAWNVPSSVGTLCVVDEFYSTSNYGDDDMVTFRANGLERFRLVHLDDDRKTATIIPFSDAPTAPEDMDTVVDLEKDLMESMQEIVRLTQKIGGSGDMDETHQRALNETLRRVKAVCAQNTSTSSSDLEIEPENGDADVDMVERWGGELSSDKRREILSFVVLDLLNLSFMSRRSLMMGVDTRQRLEDALEAL